MITSASAAQSGRAAGTSSLFSGATNAIITAAQQAVATAVAQPATPTPQPAAVAATQQMATSSASSTGSTTPATGQSSTGSPIPVPSWVTKTSTTNGKIYWWISGQTVTQNGAQVYVPGHWVPEGSVTGPTLDPTQVVVAPKKTPEQEAADAALAMVMTGTPSFVMTQDDFQDRFVQDTMGAGSTADQANLLLDEHGNKWRDGGGNGQLTIMLDGGPRWTWATYTNLTGANAQYNGRTLLLLTPDEANLARDSGKTPHDWFFSECSRVANAKDAANKAAAAAAKQPTTPAPGTSIKPIGTTTSSAAASATTRNIIIAAAAAACAYLLLS